MDLTAYHYVSLFRENIQKYPKKEALMRKIDAHWQPISWEKLGTITTQLSKALLQQGVAPQQTVGILSQNTPQWTLTDLACLQIRAVTVPIYTSNTAEQALYVMNHAEIKFLFVGDEKQYLKALEVADQCLSLQKIILFDDHIQLKEQKYSIHWTDFLAFGNNNALDEELQQRIDSRDLSDLFTVIYTSGTTGEPKGVMLTYENLAYQMLGHSQRLEVDDTDSSLSFLPLTHVYERAWTSFCLYKAIVVYYLEDTNLVREALAEVRPTLMCAVPRFYEKIFATVHDKADASSFAKRMLFKLAVKTGRRVLTLKEQNRKPSFLLKKAYNFFDKMVYTKLKAVLGGRIKFMPCGGANLEPSIGRFFQSIGINVKLGYGMTETTATVSCWGDNRFNLQSVGTLMPNVQVRIGEDNEILVKGGMVMKGYYKNPEETAKAFTPDGFLRTGDAGKIDENNNLFITERIKELMKTSNGKYIAPQLIEGKVGKYNLIEQIAVIADGKKFVSALIVPNYEILTQAFKDLNIKYKNTADLIKHSQVIEYIGKQLQKFQSDLPDYEQIKKFTLLPTAFSIERNEITPTLKLRRKVIYANYSREIEAMYR
ncbi:MULTISPECIES: long-chain fatty acid--CoA ligase [Capnocytophaga]|uniref:AMP-dependent synthetase/ligase n=1 Tax=Capnocytophaga TaxID=1016 RepID=UPI00020C670B|nr:MULTISPECIES: long-chain fatty acid--CoA ligase [Capnocytophaga]KHE71018.1 AMP-binding enzyme [Capnocytophaga sp. oral taxon 329 str. F0087]QGS17199.1 AMP-binding protein [Capnocytophaga sp. FDAARGOS_737]